MNERDPNFKQEIISTPGGESLMGCFQCGICTSSCIYSQWLDLKPHQIMKMTTLGFRDELLNSDMIWVCSSCYACTVRCPQEVDVKEVMDTVRRIALIDKGYVRDEKTFFSKFLNLIENYGRLNMAWLFLQMAKKEDIFKNLSLGLSLFKQGKVKLLPGKLKNQKELKELFKKTKERSK